MCRESDLLSLAWDPSYLVGNTKLSLLISSVLFLDYSDIYQVIRWQMLSQGEYTLEHTVNFRQLNYMEPLSFDRSYIGSWDIKILHIYCPWLWEQVKAYNFVYCISLELFLSMPFVIILKLPFLFLGESLFLGWTKLHRCGRTVWNNTPFEALVFHQTLSAPKASYIGRVLSGTPQGRARIVHIFPTRIQPWEPVRILNPFHTSRVLKNILLQYQIQSTEY